MYIKSLELTNFRNYWHSNFKFDKNINVIVGKNGIGKTNILESIYFLTFGKSWKTLYDYEAISTGKIFSNIKAVIEKNDEDINLFVGIEKGIGNNSRKVFKINEVTKTNAYFTKEIKSITFSPADLEIILLSPSIRRRFLNEILIQIDEVYKSYVSKLTKIVANRNRILKRVREGLSTYDECEYYTNELIEKSNYIQQKRDNLIININKYLEQNFVKFSNSNSSASVVFKKNTVTKEKIINYKDAEIASKQTLFGAQKDDFEVIFNKNNDSYNAKYFASRGEQRTIVFVLKLGALNFIERETNTNLILLLDDIYSELDEIHRNAISEFLNKNQTIITTAEKELVPQEILNRARIIEL